jgi:predicted nuclease of predicted toxin-antitoxin system
VIRLLLDQGLPRSAAGILRTQGWDVVHVGECGLAMASDTRILEAARLEQRHVITLDADFHAILAISGAVVPSVLRLRIEGLKGGDLAMLLQRLWPRISLAMSDGAMVTATDRTVRIKRLPVGR